MGQPLGSSLSNLNVSHCAKKDIQDYLTNTIIEKGLPYETYMKHGGRQSFWPKKVRESYNAGNKLSINCLKTESDTSNDHEHYLKLKEQLSSVRSPNTLLK